jgi:lipid A ethanolaminephosphotransferase
MSNPVRLRFRVSHVRFSIGFPVALYAVCNAVNLERLAKWFRHGDRPDYLGLSAYLLAGLCLFIVVFTLLAHRRTIKPFAILLTILSATATYFIAKYGVGIDSSMILNAVHTDSTEVGQLLSPQMLPYAVILIALPAWLIVSTDIAFAPSRYFLASLKVMGVALSVALLSVYAEYSAIFQAGNVSNKYIVYSLVPINIISGSFSAATNPLKPYLRKRQQNVAISARVATPGNLVVVLAIGEASRKKNFGVYGYERRNTTPILQKTEGLHLLNGIASRASTLYALPKILEKNHIKLTTIVSRVGIRTSCYVNYTLYDNCELPGETTVSNCGHGGKCYDEDVVPMLKSNVGTYESGYRFIVLHLGGGSHGPMYRDRYPPEFQQFEPMCMDADVINKCTLDQLYNAYDNSILYVDHVLGQVIQTLDQSGVPYVFIYVSDHGESLMEGGVVFHGGPPGIALPAEQAQIPLIVKSSVPISIVGRREYRQPDVYDTVLDLFSIQSATFDRAGSFIKTGAAPP